MGGEQENGRPTVDAYVAFSVSQTCKVGLVSRTSQRCADLILLHIQKRRKSSTNIFANIDRSEPASPGILSVPCASRHSTGSIT